MRLRYCHDLSKQLSHYLYFFSFYFIFGLTTQGRSVGKCHISQSHGIESHDECGRIVHRPCSSCIRSVQNLIGTLLSSPCQLGLRW